MWTAVIYIFLRKALRTICSSLVSLFICSQCSIHNLHHQPVFKNENDTEQRPEATQIKTYNVKKETCLVLSYWNLRTVNLSVCCLLAPNPSFFVLLSNAESSTTGSPLPVGAMLSFVSRGAGAKGRRGFSLWLGILLFSCNAWLSGSLQDTQRHSLWALTLTRTQHVSQHPAGTDPEISIASQQAVTQ